MQIVTKPPENAGRNVRVDVMSEVAKTEITGDTPEYLAAVDKAAHEYLERRNKWPWGRGYMKSCQKWYPNPDEKCCVCASIRPPSCTYPNSLIKHSTTMFHISDKNGVSESDVRARVKALKKAEAA
jgi:hypothetical protein